MSLTPSTMPDLGTPAADFALPDVVTGKTVRLSDFASSNALLIIFLCKHCPYVVHVQDELARIGMEYVPRGAALVGISSNDVGTHPEDCPEKLKDMAVKLNLNFPVLYDETQRVAKAYTAACTPDFFLYDGDRNLAYRGQLDDSRPNSGKPVTGKDLRAALDAVLEGKAVSAEQRPSTGCNIKWKPGNEPPAFLNGLRP